MAARQKVEVKVKLNADSAKKKIEALKKRAAKATKTREKRAKSVEKGMKERLTKIRKAGTVARGGGAGMAGAAVSSAVGAAGAATGLAAALAPVLVPIMIILAILLLIYAIVKALSTWAKTIAQRIDDWFPEASAKMEELADKTTEGFAKIETALPSFMKAVDTKAKFAGIGEKTDLMDNFDTYHGAAKRNYMLESRASGRRRGDYVDMMMQFAGFSK